MVVWSGIGPSNNLIPWKSSQLDHLKQIAYPEIVDQIKGADLFWDFFLFFWGIFFFLVCGLCACFFSSSRGVVGWCFCGGVVVFLW